MLHYNVRQSLSTTQGPQFASFGVSETSVYVPFSVADLLPSHYTVYT